MEKTRKSILGRDLLIRIEKEKCIPDDILIRSGDQNRSIPRGRYGEFTALEIIMGHTKEFGRLEFYELIDSDVIHTDVSRLTNDLVAKIGAECLVGITDEFDVTVSHSNSRSNCTRLFECKMDVHGLVQHFSVAVTVTGLNK